MRIIILGGGIIGMAVARELAGGSHAIIVIEPSLPGAEASWAAAGLLAPDSEEHASKPFRELCLAGRDLYPEYVAALEKETGDSVGLRTEGLLVLNPSGSVDTALREPEMVWRPARFYPREYSVDNRLLLKTLEKSCRQHGVHFERGSAERVESGPAVVLKSGQRLTADAIVNAAGCWASQIKAPGVEFTVRPVKGQMAAVRAEGWTLRHAVRDAHVYLVPRNDGRIVIGATMEEAGYDKTVIPETIRALLEAAAAIVPKVHNAQVMETWAGLRPATPNGLPLIGPTRLPGYYLATGHLRNGILLGPLTAKLLAETIRTGEVPALLRAFPPPRA